MLIISNSTNLGLGDKAIINIKLTRIKLCIFNLYVVNIQNSDKKKKKKRRNNYTILCMVRNILYIFVTLLYFK